MKMIGCVIAAIVLATFSQLAGQEPPTSQQEMPFPTDEEKFDFWMSVKLRESQKILEALARADFDGLVTGSETLETLSAIEGFVRSRTPGYPTQLRAFEFAVKDIKAQAERKSIEGVTLGFHQLTLSCVNCHKQIREPLASAAER